MLVMFIGAMIGLLIGAVLGGGAFGPLGILAGAALGTFTGAIVMPLMQSASADEFARHPHMVSCPATGTEMPITVTRESARKAAFNRGELPRVEDCPRWREIGRCSGPCASQLHV